ncbi:hypothetical protein PL321_03030 [Caloramator sp. mosi_1]|nr:hypothetical protein [Caloramator sp. mosi_1]WDC84678.1 hypothetical protein PL321_03030 [Caloramator sp. mosi_1]
MVGAHIKSIGDIEDRGFDFSNINDETLNLLQNTEFAVLDDNAGEK